MKFYPKEHKYIHKNKQYTPCTTLIKQMFPVFKKSNISKQYAIKHNLRKKDVLKKWKLIGKQASTVGTIIHEIAEDLINTKTKTHRSIKYYKLNFNLNKKQVQKVLDLTENVKRIIPVLPVPPKGKIFTEQILWDEKRLISGTVDLIIWNEEANIFHILDWKTSKTITRVPFNIMDRDLMGFNIPHANYYHYSIQMAVYQHLIQTTPGIGALTGTETKFKNSIIHIPSESIIDIPDNEIIENQVYVQSLLKKYI